MGIKNVSISEIADVILGQSPPSSSYNDTGVGLPFYQGKSDFGDKYPIPREWCSDPTRIAEKDDILMSVRAPVGPVNLANEKSAIGRGLAAIRAKNEIDFKYLYFYLRFNPLKISQYATGSTFKAISRKDINRISIPIPITKEKKKRIAQVLSDCEDLIAKRKQSIELLDELVKSTFLEMFGDPVMNEKGWEISTIGEKYFVKGGKRVPKGHKLIDVNTGFKYIKAGNIKKGTITETDIQYLTPETQKSIAKYTVDEGDVVMTVVGVNIGDVGVVPSAFDKANLTENANKFIVKNDTSLESSFLAYYLMSDFVQQQVIGKVRAAGVPKLAIFRIEQVPLPIPDKKTQSNFSNALELINQLKRLYEDHFVELRNLYSRFSQDAFRGELDVSKVELREEVINEA